jgi:hypothetical protein
MSNIEVQTELPATTQVESIPSAIVEQTSEVLVTKALSTVSLNKCANNLTATEMIPEPVAATSATTKSLNQRYFRDQFEQKSKIIQEFWSQHQQNLIKLNRDHSQLIIIIIMSIIGLLCSLIAISSNSWICDTNTNQCYGLWNTCYLSEKLSNDTASMLNDMNNNETMIEQLPKSSVLCAQQGLYDIKIEYALQSRIDQVATAQGLIVSGCILYAFSVLTVILAYRYINMNNLNSVRNTLVTSICVQIFAFLMMLVGFFLFILTERLALSVILVFVYFGLTMLATNLINFITIEYKTFKTRQFAI